jgi:hypothetical protein
MDELQTLGTLLIRDPSPEVTERGRRALQIEISGLTAGRGTATRAAARQPAWLARRVAGLGLFAAAATAAAVVLVSGVTSPAVVRHVVKLSGRQVLLAAATTAARQPAAVGTYWYVKVEVAPPAPATDFTLQTWIAHDGSSWGGPDPAGTAGISPENGPQGFQVAGSSLTFAQLQDLPTSPAALEAWIARSEAHPRNSLVQPSGTHHPEARGMAWDLAGLLANAASIPAPPAVRAAAFEALAALPGVTSIGSVPGGQGLLIPVQPPSAGQFPGGKVPAGASQLQLVIDPATAQIYSETNFEGTETFLAAHWTNTLPSLAK